VESLLVCDVQFFDDAFYDVPVEAGLGDQRSPEGYKLIVDPGVDRAGVWLFLRRQSLYSVFFTHCH